LGNSVSTLPAESAAAWCSVTDFNKVNKIGVGFPERSWDVDLIVDLHVNSGTVKISVKNRQWYRHCSYEGTMIPSRVKRKRTSVWLRSSFVKHASLVLVAF
jgi:hypothetical protein